MKYNPPYGSADPSAAYVDRNTSGAVAGSKVPGKAIEDPQREILAVITSAGLTPDPADMTQLLQAIQVKIAEITGSGDTENFVTMTQARGRMPVFPEILTTDGKIPVLTPATGQVRVPAGYEFLHRGIFSVTTTQVDFVTAINKTYHLRWSPSGGFVLKDLADVSYNPTALAEGNSAFDSSYDDMLISRVVTSGANVATITNLVNRNRLSAMITDAGAMTTNSADNGASRTAVLNWSWARVPLCQVSPVAMAVGPGSSGQFGSSDLHDHDFGITKSNLTRYGASILLERDYASGMTIEAFISA